MNTLQAIFTDHYEEIIYTLHPRKTEVENIEKMIHCGDSSHGGAMFGCPHCGNLKFSPFRCKSRFCPSCGNKYNQQRSFSMSCKLTHPFSRTDQIRNPLQLPVRGTVICIRAKHHKIKEIGISVGMNLPISHNVTKKIPVHPAPWIIYNLLNF